MTLDQRLAALDINDIDITLLKLVHQKLISTPQIDFQFAGHSFSEFILCIKKQEYEATWLPLLWKIFHYDPESFLSALQILRKVAALEFDGAGLQATRSLTELAATSDLPQAPIAVLTLDNQQRARFANPLFLTNFGAGDLAGITGKSIEELIFNEQLLAAVKSALEGVQSRQNLLVSLEDHS
ncbi:hypothetical protein, partial [Undibacterium sp.]|uniref:hypothetical protein n=1 Tax=Undibacterium sp. TaxID=1914977 RepID=UPI002CE504C0